MNQVPDRTFILTAELDAESFTWLDSLRHTHFPPERNVLSAHLTMFHRLSPLHIDQLLATPIPSQPIGIVFDAVMFLGFGNAIRAHSPKLEELRQILKDKMGDGLSRQDNQRWSPHVTIQNKVQADEARALHRALDSNFMRREGSALSLLAWEYVGGPWKLVSRLPFAKDDQTRQI